MRSSSPESRRSVGRRAVLSICLGSIAAAGAAALALSSRTNRYRLKAFLGRFVLAEPRLDATSPAGDPTEAELATLVALAEILLPEEPGVDAAGFARHHAGRRAAEEPGYLDQYRRAVALLDLASRRTGGEARFADSSRGQRQATLESLLWSYPASNLASRYLENALSSAPELAFRRFVVSDLLTAFYASPQGWAVLGYRHYPGVPAADPLDYTRPVESSGRG